MFLIKNPSLVEMPNIITRMIKGEKSTSFGFNPGERLGGDFVGVYCGIYRGRINGKGPIVKASIVQKKDGTYYRYCGGKARSIGQP